MRGEVTYTGEVGVLGWGRRGSGQNAPRHLLLQSGHGDLQQHVEVLPLVLVVLGSDGLKGPTEGADKPSRGVDKIRLDAGGMVNPVTVPTQENFPAGWRRKYFRISQENSYFFRLTVAVEAVPIVTLIGQHVL